MPQVENNVCLDCGMRRIRLDIVVRLSSQPSTPISSESGLFPDGSLLTIRLSIVLLVNAIPIPVLLPFFERFIWRYHTFTFFDALWVFFFTRLFLLDFLVFLLGEYFASSSSNFCRYVCWPGIISGALAKAGAWTAGVVTSVKSILRAMRGNDVVSSTFFSFVSSSSS